MRVGITDYAQGHLGDLTFVEFPQVGDVFAKGAQCGSLESTKAVSEIFYAGQRRDRGGKRGPC